MGSDFFLVNHTDELQFFLLKFVYKNLHIKLELQVWIFLPVSWLINVMSITNLALLQQPNTSVRWLDCYICDWYDINQSAERKKILQSEVQNIYDHNVIP